VSEKKRPLLLLTIDVEEDMPDWEVVSPSQVTNVRALPRLAEMCRDLGVLPTYLCSYPVLRDYESRGILEGLLADGGCEFGTHLHAWTTPPYEGLPGQPGVDEREVAYYQFEIPVDSFRAKLETLHTELTGLIGCEPTCFRSGRFGIDGPTLAALPDLGYRVDSSVTPLANHTKDGGPDFRTAPQVPYRPSGQDPCSRGNLPIIEVPVSVGLTRRMPERMKRTYVQIPQRTHVRGLLSRDFLRVVDFAWLYPARFDLDLMTRAARTLHAEGNPVLNVFLHSSELLPNVSGPLRGAGEIEEVMTRLEGILSYCMSELGARPATLGAIAPEMEAWVDARRSAADTGAGRAS
jgi:hypothetical protein